jgi:hypothetical protein
MLTTKELETTSFGVSFGGGLKIRMLDDSAILKFLDAEAEQRTTITMTRRGR